MLHEQKTEIENTVNNYFSAYLNAEADLLSTAFHGETKLLSVDQGRLETTEMKEWMQNLRDRKQKGDIRKAKVEILNIDIAGTAAIAKTHLAFEKFSFTDYLSLLRINGHWSIVNKIYSIETHEG